MNRFLVAAMCVMPFGQAAAQQAPDAGAWSVKGDRATAISSGISVPTHPDKIGLIKTTEASHKGKGIDNVAQYESEDGKIFATVYIFYTSYADTALAAWATDRAIRSRFGPDVVLASENMVTIAGIPNSGIRHIYTKAVSSSGEQLVTTAGFVRAGSWLAALRVSGPADRQPEVERTLDALAAGVRFDGKDKPMTAAPLKLAAPCPVGPEKPAKYLDGKKAQAVAMLSALMGGSVASDDEEKDTTEVMPKPLAFPGNGTSALCMRGTIERGETRYDVLQPANAEERTVLLVPIDDAGSVLSVEPAPLTDGYIVKRYGIGFTDMLGSFKTLPSLVQLRAILTGKDKKGSIVRSSTVFTPDGNSTININSDMLK